MKRFSVPRIHGDFKMYYRQGSDVTVGPIRQAAAGGSRARKDQIDEIALRLALCVYLTTLDDAHFGPSFCRDPPSLVYII